jgi:hypothetical protein
MFCPKCGTQNPDNGKFCRSCGTNLVPVSEALSGELNARNSNSGIMPPAAMAGRRSSSGEPISWESALRRIFMGLAFLIVTGVLAFSRMGRGWWFWMLIPAFALLGSGIAQYVQLKKQEQQSKLPPAAEPEKAFSPPPANASLPPTQNDYISPARQTSYKTGELVPPSVVEDTTRQLEVNQEGETMTLPKSKQ